MLNVSSQTKIYVYASAADMRKGINGLSGIVREQFAADPTNGSLFVFVNRRRDRMKILYFDGGGFWLYYRLLEAGTFEELKNPQEAAYLTIDATQLEMLLAGISLRASKHRRLRYSKQQGEQAA